MQVGQTVEVQGNGISGLCLVHGIGFTGYRSDYVQVKHTNGKIYFVEIKNCKVQSGTRQFLVQSTRNSN